MPIRPELRHLYRGPEWRAVRERILARAEHRCERCHAPNRQVVLRQFGWWTECTLPATLWAQGGRFTVDEPSFERDGALITNASGRQFIALPWKVWNDAIGKFVERQACFPNTGQHRYVAIVLTIAHLNHVAGDNRDENLQALCQWCHFHHDQDFHAANARNTRVTRKDAERPLLVEEARR